MRRRWPLSMAARGYPGEQPFADVASMSYVEVSTGHAVAPKMHPCGFHRHVVLKGTQQRRSINRIKFAHLHTVERLAKTQWELAMHRQLVHPNVRPSQPPNSALSSPLEPPHAVAVCLDSREQ